MKYTHVVWDFNGTIIDDVNVGIKSVNPLLAARKLPIIENKALYRELFDFPIIDYYRRLGFDFSKEPYEKIAVEWVDNYKANSHRIGLVCGASDVIEFACAHKMKNMILSASEKEMLEKKLFELGILDKFDCILALDNIYAHSKKDIARDYFENRDTSKYLMIGDTVHDFEVARAVGMDIFLVACGHQSYERLKLTGAKVFENMSQLLDYLKNMQLRQNL